MYTQKEKKCSTALYTMKALRVHMHSFIRHILNEPLHEILQQCVMCDQQNLKSACAYTQSDQSLCKSLEYSMTVKLLTEHHLEFLSLKGGCTGSNESTLVKMPHCWKCHTATQMLCISTRLFIANSLKTYLTFSRKIYMRQDWGFWCQWRSQAAKAQNINDVAKQRRLRLMTQSKQRRLRRPCANAQTAQGLRCSDIQSVDVDECLSSKHLSGYVSVSV